ncbi:sensor histidine kinase [Actinoplanes sp. NPDC051494]|uniref:sensor histidine kinase n=1 Tax=Actinoplanes sp. NPDC051494 TaxID=3363907 RepID=UPI00378A225F
MTRIHAVIIVLLTVLVLLITVVAAIPQTRGSSTVRPLDPAGLVLVVATVVTTLALRRRAPVWALVTAVLLVNVYLLIGYPYGAVQLCPVVAMFAVARLFPLSRSLLICGVAAACTSAIVSTRLVRDVDTPWLLALAWTGWLVVPWSLGALAHTLAFSRERLRQHLLARGALEERMKIAGEVHDVAGHGFALVAMQAGVALLVFEEEPGQARRSIEAIQTTSAKSLAALRGMLDTFHQDDAVPVATAPAPAGEPTIGLRAMVELIEQVREGGLPVRLELAVGSSPPAEVDAAAFRLV